MRPSAPVRWSWPAARRTRIQAWSSRRKSIKVPNSSANSADERDQDAEADAARQVVDLRAEPQTGERDRPPAEQADDDHPDEEQPRQRAVDALARLAAALGQRPKRTGAVPGRRPTNRPPVSVGSRAHHSSLCSQLCGARQPAYSESSTSAYFSFTTLRLTFSVGVSSPVSWDRSWSRIANFLTCSTWA